MNDQHRGSSDMALVGFDLDNVGETSATLPGLEDLPDYQQSVANVAGQLNEHSARIYRSEAKIFAAWLYEHNYQTITREPSSPTTSNYGSTSQIRLRVNGVWSSRS